MKTQEKRNRWSNFHYYSFFLLVMVFSGCKAEPIQAEPEKAAVKPINAKASGDISLDSAVNFLLNVSAHDFQKQHLSLPVKFRNMRVGHILKADGVKQYMMCGEFLPKDKEESNEWVAFATIRTLDYELWTGDQSKPFCEDKSVVWEKRGDLAAELITRIKAK